MGVGTKLALQDPNLRPQLPFVVKAYICWIREEVFNLSMNRYEQHKIYNEAKMRTQQNQSDETLGDTWGIKQHNWNTETNENHQLDLRWAEKQI